MEQNLSKLSEKALIVLATELEKDFEKWSKEEGYGLNSEGQWDAPVPPFIANEAGEVIILNMREQNLTAVPEALHWQKFKKLRAIDLGSNNLTKIDLSAFSGMKNLEKIYLSNNQFTEIDLSPLSNLHKLKELFLSRNLLKGLDLSPLNSHKNIEVIGLSENHFGSIDISPLSNFQNLVDLRLDFTELKTIDLSPLSLLSKLSVLWLNKNKLTNITNLGICSNALPEVESVVSILSFQNLKKFSRVTPILI